MSHDVAAGRPGAFARTRVRVSGAALAYAVLGISLAAFLAAGGHQLALPGLQYDEAKEAGLNALQLVAGQPVTAFRDAVLTIGPWHVPLMVQDYIGSLNVLLAIPFLAVGRLLSGGSAAPETMVAALRWLPLLIAAVTLWLSWRVALRLGGPLAASATAVLLAVNPSFIFWSRQGVFVTNITALFLVASLLAGLAWWQTSRRGYLCLTALLWGLGIYGKLLFVWAIGAMAVVAAAAWLLATGSRVREPQAEGRLGAPQGALGSRLARAVTGGIDRPRLSVRDLAWAAVCFVLPLVPLILFNLQTDGTLTSIFGNLGHSYYGVDNRAYVPNLLTRLDQLRILLRGDHLWYLGEVYANRLAPWIALGLSAAGIALGRTPRQRLAALLPVLLLALMVAQSAFTVSDLFITHDALLLPLVPLAGGLGLAALWPGGAARDLTLAAGDRLPRWRALGAAALALVGLAALVWWGGVDAVDTLKYHRVLAESGGYGSHSDAIYRLEAYLQQTAPSAPLALDWGTDAQLRFLSGGRVNPVEVFGYSPIDKPDPGFAGRVQPFLADPNTLYVAHTPDQTVFQGRVDALAALAQQSGRTLQEVARFGIRSGKPLFVVYKVE